MANSSIGQSSGFFKLLSDYYSSNAAYLASPTGESPLFMETLMSLEFSQIITESQNRAKGLPSMVSGALIESANAIFATIRDAGLRSKIRADFFAEADAESGQDAKFYMEQGQLLSSFISGRNDAQN